MNKNKGFTLIEVLVSIVLISFVIMMSSSLFDHSIQSAPRIKNIINENNKSISQIEDNIQIARGYTQYYNTLSMFDNGIRDIYSDRSQILALKPNGYDTVGNPIKTKVDFDFKFSTNTRQIRDVEGYFLSFQNGNSNVVYNDLKETDILATFVGLGATLSPTSIIKNMYVNQNRFIIMPISHSSDIALSFGYDVEDKYGSFYKVRTNTLISPIYNKNKGVIYTPYSDITKLRYSVSNDNYLNIGEAKEFEDKSSGNISIKIIKPYSSDKKEYLNSIDRSYAANALTLNNNLRVSQQNSTFNNTNNSKNTTTHIIGVPYTSNLVGFYDYNLAIAKINGENKYDLIFSKSAPTSYDSMIKDVKGTDEYLKFNWKNNDVLSMLSLGGSSPNNVIFNDGFTGKIGIKQETGVVEEPFVQKSYGNSLYYSMDNKIADVKLNNNDITIFLKFNTKNYNKIFKGTDKHSPFVVASYNFDLKNGTMIDKSKNGAFALYIEDNGSLKLSTININSAKKEEHKTEEIVANIYDYTKLYTNDSSFKFNMLANTDMSKIKATRDEREDFIILPLSIRKNPSNIELKIGLLNRINSINDIKTDLKLWTRNINMISIDSVSIGGTIKKSMNGSSAVDYASSIVSDSAVELSDMIVYNENLFDKKYKSSSSYSSLISDYLYRKYLTEDERGSVGKFDDYFIGKY